MMEITNLLNRLRQERDSIDADIARLERPGGPSHLFSVPPRRLATKSPDDGSSGVCRIQNPAPSR
jgi:hypothetical protein